jgi:hypothetical protein
VGQLSAGKAGTRVRADYQLYRRGLLPSSTLGVAGTATACAQAGAKIYLPYAHGLTGYGRPLVENPFGPGPGLDERAACQAMAEELSRIGCQTAVFDWNVGGRWTPDNGDGRLPTPSTRTTGRIGTLTALPNRQSSVRGPAAVVDERVAR